MQFSVLTRLYAVTGLVAILALPGALALAQESPGDLLAQLNDFPHARQIAYSEEPVVDYELGLGAIKKVRGVWQFKASERQSGVLTRYTWQIVDGFTSREVLEELAGRVEAREGVQLLFQCEGRACGHGSQWANRVFGQRILYGREDLQQYRIYTMTAAADYRLVMFSAARTADRQYLHVELLKLGSEDQGASE